MEAVGVRDAVEALIGIDLSVASHGEVAVASAAMARVQAFVDLAKVQIARRGRELAEGGDTGSAHALIDEGRCTGNDAKTTNGRDQVCATLPEFEQALADGAVTGAHLDALHQHTKGLTDAERAEVADLAGSLVADATAQPAALFDRNVKALVDKIRELHRPGSDADELDRQRAASKVKRWTERETGMQHTLISLDPLRDASLWAVIDHHLARLRHDPAHAERPYAELQVAAVMAAVAAGEPAVRVPEVVVHVDAASLCHGRHPDTICETIDGVPVPVATVQRLCCEAILQAVVVNPDGTADQLCETHHHLVHEGGWHLTIDQHRHVSWTRPDGTTWHTDTGPNRPPPHTRATTTQQAATDRQRRPPGRPRGRPPDRPPVPPWNTVPTEQPLQTSLL